MKPFAEAIADVSGGNPKLLQSAIAATGALPVVDQGQKFIAGYTDDETLRCRADGPLIIFGDHTRVFKYVDFPFVIGADGVKLLRVRAGWDPRYAYHYLQSRTIPSAGYSRHFKFLKQLEIPQPPLDAQRRIAAILDHADALRAKRSQILAHLGTLTDSIFQDIFSNDDPWPTDPIGSLGVVTTGRTPPTAEPGMFDGLIPFVTPGDLASGRRVVRTVTEAGAAASRLVRTGSESVNLIEAGSVGIY